LLQLGFASGYMCIVGALSVEAQLPECPLCGTTRIAASRTSF